MDRRATPEPCKGVVGSTQRALPERRLMAAAVCSVCRVAVGLICALQSRTPWAAWVSPVGTGIRPRESQGPRRVHGHLVCCGLHRAGTRVGWAGQKLRRDHKCSVQAWSFRPSLCSQAGDLPTSSKSNTSCRGLSMPHTSYESYPLYLLPTDLHIITQHSIFHSLSLWLCYSL